MILTLDLVISHARGRFCQKQYLKIYSRNPHARDGGLEEVGATRLQKNELVDPAHCLRVRFERVVKNETKTVVLPDRLRVPSVLCE